MASSRAVGSKGLEENHRQEFRQNRVSPRSFLSRLGRSRLRFEETIMAAFFTSYDAAPGYPKATVRTARQPTIEIGALLSRLWDITLEIVVFLWAVVASAFFGLIAVGFWFA